MYLFGINPSVFLVASCLAFSGCTTATNKSGFPADGRPIKSNNQAAREANERGLALVEQDKFDLAEGAFREAIGHNFQYTAAHNNLGLVLLQKGKAYEAATELRTAESLDPAAAEPLRNMELLYECIGRTKQAKSENQSIHKSQSLKTKERKEFLEN